MKSKGANALIQEDITIPTLCGRCYANCAIRVQRINGVAVRIEGNPDSTMGSEGGLCAKGCSGLQVLYDPNRLNKPLRRTNPEKGLFVDPRWKEITWDEAFAEIVPRLEKIINEQPGKLLMQSSTIRPARRPERMPFGAVTGPPSFFVGGGGLHCGQGAHPMAGMVHGSWSVVPDFKYCNYAIYFGASKGHGSGHSAMITARLAAEAKGRGMKLVVFDPTCITAGGKAAEWIPVIPGVDGAIVLAMCNVIVNELGRYDATFLKLKTNAPYLIGPDGRYVRENGPARGVKDPHSGGGIVYVGDDDTNKPLIWDAADGRAKVYDDPGIKEYALDGEYTVDGKTCTPVFQRVREHLKGYSCEMASEVSTVPAETIRRIAAEFAEAAQIGSTITIEGRKLPFRPASAVIFRGGQGHENSHHTCFSVALLNSIIGGCDVPGGTLGWPARCFGFPGTGKIKCEPWKGVDGFLQIEHFGPESGGVVHTHGPWPVAYPRNACQLGLLDLFPLAPFPFIFGSSDQDELWKKIGTDYRIEMLMVWGCNSVLSTASREILDKALKKIPFTVVFELFNTELTEGYADIVLPDTCYLEELHWSEGLGLNFNHAFGMDDWCYHLVQPVVEPAAGRREYTEVLYEFADRLGRRDRLNRAMNQLYGLDKEYAFKPDEKVFMPAICDRVLRNLFGPDRGLDYFKKHGFIRWEKQVEEAYWRYEIDARVPIYLEYMLDVGKTLGKLSSELHLDVDLSPYTPLISWFPCSIHEQTDPAYDLYCYSYRDVLHTGSSTMEQPWLDEASLMNPYTYHITMNTMKARDLGIHDGDGIELESAYGKKVRGIVRTIEGQHPLTVGIAACSGHWARGMPIAKDKGTNFDMLLEIDLEHCDPVSLNLETAVRVKARKMK